MTASLTTRYPGSRPFEDNAIERLLFRGRERETRALLHTILAEELVLVYSKSGVGKTSLLKAGVMEPLREAGLWPLLLRLNTPDHGLVESLRRQIETATAEVEGLDVSIDATSTHLARFFGGLQIWRGDRLLTPVVMFDQFEELFTLVDDAHRESFIAGFSDLVRRRVEGPDGKLVALPRMKLVVCLREDYLGELEEVAAQVPQVMQNRFRLTPLTRAQAEQAIREPAKIEHAEIDTPRFTYYKKAVDQILDFLCTRRERNRVRQVDEVEPFQLQLICQDLERRILRKQKDGQKRLSVRPGDLGGEEEMRRILQDFYRRVVERFPESVRAGIRRLCEEGLISFSEKRLSLEQDEIGRAFGVDREVLDALVSQRLLRSEPRVGSEYYELSHDTLVAPILADRGERDPVQLLESAEKYAAAGDAERAAETYERILALDPTHKLAYVKGAEHFLSLGRLDRAMQLLERALSAGVDDEAIHHRLGVALFQAGDVKRSVKHFERALELDPERAEIHLGLGDALRQDKREKRALEHYERSVELASATANANVLRAAAVRFVRHGDARRALAIFEVAVAADPEYGYIFEDLMSALRDAGRLDAARELGLSALKVETSNAAYYSRLGYELLGLEELEAARQALEASHALDSGDQYTLYNLGYVLGELGEYEQAIEKYREALGLDPEYTDALFNWALCLGQLGRGEQAIEKYQEVIDQDPVYIDAYREWALELAESDAREEANKVFEQAHAVDPEDATVLSNWGGNLEEMGRFEEAIEKHRRAIDLAPDDLGVVINIGWAYYLSGDLERFVEWSRKAVAMEPESLIARSNLALGLLVRGDTLEATAEYDNVVTLGIRHNDPEEFESHAIHDLRKALAADPELSGGEDILAMLERVLTSRFQIA